jgi:hypothetical protein
VKTTLTSEIPVPIESTEFLKHSVSSAHPQKYACASYQHAFYYSSVCPVHPGSYECHDKGFPLSAAFSSEDSKSSASSTYYRFGHQLRPACDRSGAIWLKAGMKTGRCLRGWSRFGAFIGWTGLSWCHPNGRCWKVGRSIRWNLRTSHFVEGCA